MSGANPDFVNEKLTTADIQKPWTTLGFSWRMNYIHYEPPATPCMPMNMGVINGLGSDGQVGHHLARVLRKQHSSTAISDIRYRLPMPRAGSFSRVSSVVLRIPSCLKTS